MNHRLKFSFNNFDLELHFRVNSASDRRFLRLGKADRDRFTAFGLLFADTFAIELEHNVMCGVVFVGEGKLVADFDRNLRLTKGLVLLSDDMFGLGSAARFCSSLLVGCAPGRESAVG